MKKLPEWLLRIVDLLPIILGAVFACLNAFLGIRYESRWNGTLAAYFLLLTFLRILLLLCGCMRRWGNFHRWELRMYVVCGMLLSILSYTLAKTVILLTHGALGKNYPGYLVYAVAAYTFYKVGVSVYGMVTARRQESLLLIAQRNIDHVDALMSLLCLQTGLLNAFNRENADVTILMNGITGGFVALAAFTMGISMIIGGQKRRKRYDSDLDSR